MVNGNIVYNGEAAASMNYFAKINMAVPMHSNPTDHYMKVMNKEGIMLKYIEDKVDFTEEQVNK
jgi:hypothetical protein